jgi:hypothetical protein
MKEHDLRELIAKQKELGLSLCVLKMPMPKSWRNWRNRGERVRTPFGLCRWNHIAQDTLAIYVEVERLEQFVRRVEAESK